LLSRLPEIFGQHRRLAVLREQRHCSFPVVLTAFAANCHAMYSLLTSACEEWLNLLESCFRQMLPMSTATLLSNFGNLRVT
jgi:hypothetical protein